MASDLDILQGEWIVRVQGWVRAYTFASGGRLSWKDTRSSEQGTGTWSPTAKSVNISWNEGRTKESWLRPLTASSKKTWYSSSYFNGVYQIDKKAATSGALAGAISLDKPPYELRYILDPADVKGPDYPSETFRVLKEKEIRQQGEYRTSRLVLAAWDRMEAGGEFSAMGM